MKLSERCAAFVLASLWISSLAVWADVNRSEWRQSQSLEVATAGLVKVSVPAATLGVLRSGATDLRLLDPAGAEVGWYLERPLRFAPESPIRRVKSAEVVLGRKATALVFETGTPLPIAGLALETGTGSFLKAVRVEGSRDGQAWEPIAEGVPVYQNYQGETRLQVRIPPQPRAWLRVTVDDARTEPVLFTGARLQLVTSGNRPGLELKPVRVVAREELPGESRLTLDLGSANLDLAALRLTSPEGVFTRAASLRTRGLAKNAWTEATIARGLLYRELGPDGTPESKPTRFEVGESVPSREVVLVIQNGDSPPLPISAVEVELPPVQLVFWARQAGRFEVLADNPSCGAPHYDLAAFSEQIKTAVPRSAVFGPLTTNPGYLAPAVVPAPFALGAALDVSAWRYRKPLAIGRDGAQQVELDPAVLSGARADLSDLRLVSEGHQRPFVRETAAGWRTVPIDTTVADDAKRPTISRWKLKLPRAGLPLVSLDADSVSVLFEREVVLFEEVKDARGEMDRRILGEARWRRTPGERPRRLSLGLSTHPVTDTLWIEIRNGDNASIQLSGITAAYPATRLHFLAPVSPATWLYYGNPKMTAPDYDLELVAARLMVADTATVTAGIEETLKAGTWSELALSGRGLWLFWAALAVVVVALLVVLRRLLPASATPASTGR